MKRLVLAGVAEDEVVSVRVGPYVPITVGLSQASVARVLYWMLDPNEGTHAEIGVRSESGRWESFEIRIYSLPIERIESGRRENPRGLQRGVPFFRRDHWEGPDSSAPLEGYSRTDEPLRLFLGEGTARLELGSAPRPIVQRVLAGDRVCFGLDEESALAVVEVLALSNEELQEIEAIVMSLRRGFLHPGKR